MINDCVIVNIIVLLTETATPSLFKHNRHFVMLVYMFITSMFTKNINIKTNLMASNVIIL